MSPRNKILSSILLYFLASVTVSIFSTEPSLVLIIGPSIVSHAVIEAAFPGLSIFSCVPVAMKSSSKCMVAGFIEAAENPDTRDLPYLSLNPPNAIGCVITGLPATRSDMKV